jgi:N-methylhydantoinase B/oxoprolinase/acetone carboxylase alpha subunit
MWFEFMDQKVGCRRRGNGTDYVVLLFIMLTTRNLGGKNTAAMNPGERIIICTPGGGAYGAERDSSDAEPGKQKKFHAGDHWRGTGSIATYHAIQESA